jgi:hypothetical protein
MSPHAVDAVARKQFAELYRHFGAGLISGGELESRAPRTREIGLHEIDATGILPFYGDFTHLKLSGKHRLTREGRRYLARIILFVRSGLPYRWPRQTGVFQLPAVLLSVITLGRFGDYWLRYRARDGDLEVWPFYTLAEYESALQRPPYLRGTRVV